MAKPKPAPVDFVVKFGENIFFSISLVIPTPLSLIKIKSVKKLPFVPNIGLLKINNKKLLTDYIEQYSYYRKDILNKFDNTFLSFSILLGQYLLGMLLYEGNYSYLSIRSVNTPDVYEHLGGPQKFKMLMSNKSLI